MSSTSAPFHPDYQQRLPLPLAQLYGRAHNAKDARGRHDNSFYLFEATAKLAAAPLVACYLAEVDAGAPRVKGLDRLLVHLVLPSLGQWVGILRQLARHFGSLPDAADHPLGHVWEQLSRSREDKPALLALFRRIKNGPTEAPGDDPSCSILLVLEALVRYRNEVFGHAGEHFDTFYQNEMGPLLFPAADELLAEGVLDFLGPAGSRLVCIDDLNPIDDRQVEVHLTELTGALAVPAAPLLLDRDEAQALAPNSVAVIWPGRKLPLRLDPLLIYRDSELAQEIFFLNRGPNAIHVEYVSYTTGHTAFTADTAPAMAGLLSRIAGSPVDVEMLLAMTEQSVAAARSVEPSIPATPVATQVLGDYSVLAEIGRGGMGIVYLARQLSLGRLVALKMLPAEMAGDDDALARFRREMMVLARCEHRNIVKVLSSGTMPDGRLYYAMEYVPGCDLEQVWRELSKHDAATPLEVSKLGDTTFARAVINASRKKREQTSNTRPGAAPGTLSDTIAAPLPLPPLPEIPSAEGDPGGYVRRVVTMIRDASLGLQSVHDQQIIHRDIKPSNLMLTADGSRVVLMDFGLAKSQNMQLTASRVGGLLGTLRYASPEQLSASTQEIGPAADVRGMGVVLWELLTRRRLFADAEDEYQLSARIHDQEVPRLRTIDPSFDTDLEAIVARATERQAADRFPTAGKLAECLDLWLDHKPLPFGPKSVLKRAARWLTPRRPRSTGSGD